MGLKRVNPYRSFDVEEDETFVEKPFFTWLSWIPLRMMLGTLSPHRLVLFITETIPTYPEVGADEGKRLRA